MYSFLIAYVAFQGHIFTVSQNYDSTLKCLEAKTEFVENATGVVLSAQCEIPPK